MNKIITPEEMVKRVMECLNAAVKDYPEDEREEAKARLLEAWQLTMFYGKVTGEQNG